MKLIVGLGNPGKNYEKTRHNCGFMAIDYYVKQNGLNYKNKFNGLYAEQLKNNKKVILLKPQTFMNLSGECVSKFVNFYNISIDDIFIIYDDINFEVGKFKIKRNGSAGGHNGINNIIQLLKTDNIKRLKIGISKNNIPLEEYVLQKFKNDEFEIISKLMNEIPQIIDDFIEKDINYVMEKYNGLNDEK